MMIEDRFYDQEWVQELSNEDFRMLHYLLHFASKKTGIVELNMRQLNFAANTGRNYTKRDVLSAFGNMLKMIPGKDNTAIFPDYIATNWAKNGKPIDAVRNPLFKSVMAELESYGLTIDALNAMAKRKVCMCSDEPRAASRATARRDTTEGDIDTMFAAFWDAYPRSCPRKVDKKKCRDKFSAVLRKAKDAVSEFNAIMNGLEVWKRCDTWTRDGGQYIMSPLRWLNNRNWEDVPKTGGGDGNAQRSGGGVATANTNYRLDDPSRTF